MKKTGGKRKRPLPYKILDMAHVSLWEEKRRLPRFLFPFEYSLDPCASCVGFCCQPVVHLTMVEVLRIALPVALALDDVVRRIPVEGTRGDEQTVPVPLDEGEVRLVLKQEQGRCVFLHAVGARSLCSVHALRPGVCRVFPYRVDVGDRIVSAGAPIACPTRWLYDDDAEKRVAGDVAGWLADLEEERALIAAWRARDDEDRSWDAFVRFAILRLAARYGLDAEVLLRAPRRRLGQGVPSGHRAIVDDDVPP